MHSISWEVKRPSSLRYRTPFDTGLLSSASWVIGMYSPSEFGGNNQCQWVETEGKVILAKYKGKRMEFYEGIDFLKDSKHHIPA